LLGDEYGGFGKVIIDYILTNFSVDSYQESMGVI